MTCFHVWCGFDGRYCGECAPRGETLREVMASGEPRAWDSDDERRGWYAGYDAAVEEQRRAALAQSSTPPASKGVEADSEAEKWRHKLWMVACHATGGGIPEIEGVDRSVNDICVQITALRNNVYQAGKDAALAAAPTPSNDTLQGRGEVEERDRILRTVWAELDRQAAIGAGEWHTCVETGLMRIEMSVDPHGLAAALQKDTRHDG